MKKGSLIVLLFLSSIVTQCQSFKDSAKRKGFSIEPIAGLGTSEAVKNGNNNLGWKAGCGLVYMFNEHWGVSSGLQIQQYSTIIHSGMDSIYVHNAPPGAFEEYDSVKTTYTFTYLEVPLLLRFVSSHYKKVGMFIEIGLIFSDIISTQASGTLYSTEITVPGRYFTTPYVFQVEEPHPYATQFNLQGHIALGVTFPISKRCSIIPAASINKGFTNVGNSNKDFISAAPSFYYYKSGNNYTPGVSNYGTNFSASFDVRLNIKLGS